MAVGHVRLRHHGSEASGGPQGDRLRFGRSTAPKVFLTKTACRWLTKIPGVNGQQRCRSHGSHGSHGLTIHVDRIRCSGVVSMFCCWGSCSLIEHLWKKKGPYCNYRFLSWRSDFSDDLISQGPFPPAMWKKNHEPIPRIDVVYHGISWCSRCLKSIIRRKWMAVHCSPGLDPSH